MKDKKKNNKMTVARVIMTVLTVTAILAIFYNSTLDASDSTGQSTPLVEWINSILARLPIPFRVSVKFVRKTAHFTEYSVLGVLLSVTYYLYLRKRKRVLLATLPTGAVIATCDELIQLIPVGRSAQVSDVLLDCCGVLFGTLLVLAIISIIKFRQRKKEQNAV